MKLVVAFCVVAAAMAQTRNQQTGNIDTATAYHTAVPNRRGAEALKASVNPSFPNAQQANAEVASANTAQENNAGQLNNPNFKVTEDNNGVKYDFAGRVAPDLTQVNYSPRDAKSCCKTKCAGDSNCEIGCDMWMAYSSLNWEPNNWRSALFERCRNQCLQPRRWAQAHEKAQHVEHSSKKVSSSYWHQDKFSAMLQQTPTSANAAEQSCMIGCSDFKECQVAQAAQ